MFIRTRTKAVPVRMMEIEGDFEIAKDNSGITVQGTKSGLVLKAPSIKMKRHVATVIPHHKVAKPVSQLITPDDGFLVIAVSTKLSADDLAELPYHFKIMVSPVDFLGE